MTKDKNIGQSFGIYTILDVYPDRHCDGHLLYVCRCNICKTKVVKKLFDITKFNTECHHTHSSWANKRIGKIFNKMFDRCYNPKCKDYKWYGQNGVKICDEWMNNPQHFEHWALCNGYDDTMTIDRINSKKDYCPENCQWIPLAENSRKAGNVNWITVGEHILTGHQWAEKLGIGTNIINTVLKKYGLDKTRELIVAMLKNPPSTKRRKANQTWLGVYRIQS